MLLNNRCGNKEMAERLFERNYNSPVYGFVDMEERRKLK